MCNINMIVKKINSIDLVLLDVVTSNSWVNNNDDGEGYLSNTFYNQSERKMSFQSNKNLLGCEFIATHQRLSTGGSDPSNIHPIAKKGIILMHNGIFMDRGGNFKSDTVEFTEAISDDIKEKGFLESLKYHLKHSDGSKSILAYDRQTTDLYYYKNVDTAFFITRGENEFFASTSQDNAIVAAGFYNWECPKRVEADILYKLQEGALLPICEIEEEYNWDSQYGIPGHYLR